MPELPEVETVRRGLAPWMEGRIFAAVKARVPRLRVALPDDLGQRLTGRRIGALGRRGKYLLVPVEGGEILIVHLGMSGRLTVNQSPEFTPSRHDHVIFGLSGHKGELPALSIVYNDPRRFGLMALCPADRLETHPLLARMGPEPLDPAFDAAMLAAALTGRRGPIKGALLDQSVVAGIGNIYACEALYRAGISPRRKAATITGGRARRLVEALKSVLGEAILSGGSSLKDHRQPSGDLGYFQHNFAVYGRAGSPCPDCACDIGQTGGISRLVQSGRSTFFCPRRQR